MLDQLREGGLLLHLILLLELAPEEPVEPVTACGRKTPPSSYACCNARSPMDPEAGDGAKKHGCGAHVESEQIYMNVWKYMGATDVVGSGVCNRKAEAWVEPDIPGRM